MEIITSKSNRYIKYAKELFAKKGREKHSAFIIEGEKFAIDIAENAALLLVSEDFYKKKGHSIDHNKAIIIENALFAQISDLENSAGIMAIVKKPQNPTTYEFLGENNGIYLILENIQDAGNMGAIFRTAFCSGVVSHIFLSKNCVDIYSPKVLRSSASFVLNMPFSIEINLANTIKKLAENGVWVYASTPHTEASLYEVDFKERTAIIIGNEGQGISDELLEIADSGIKIPSVGESLNASNAAAIMIYECYRQRRVSL